MNKRLATVLSCGLFVTGLGEFAWSQEQNCAAQPACTTCQPVVQHIHKYRHHHHCCPPSGMVVPSMAVMPVMPMAMAPVQAVPVQAAPVQPVAVQAYSPPPAPAFAVQAAPQTVNIPLQIQYTAAATAQLTLVQPEQPSGLAAAQASDAEILSALILAARRQQAAAAAQAKANAQAQAQSDGENSLERRVANLEGKVERLEAASEKLIDIVTQIKNKVDGK